MQLTSQILEYSLSEGMFYKKNVIQGPEKWQRCLHRSEIGQIVANKFEVALIDNGGCPCWPESIILDSLPNAAHVKGNRLLLTTNSTNYHAWGVLGPALLFDLKNGQFIKTLVGATGTFLNDGHFLLGLEGYDVFETKKYNNNGELVDEWRTYGHYVLGDDENIYVFEKDRNTPTRSKIALLRPNGHLISGPKLIESQVGAPILVKTIFDSDEKNKSHSVVNDLAIYVDGGNLKVIDKNLNARILLKLKDISVSDTWRFNTYLQAKNGILEIALCERSVQAPITYNTYHWLIKVGPSISEY